MNEKYKGIIPALYACYDEDGNVSSEGTKRLVNYYIEKGVKGLYVCGSSGECIYQNKEERKQILESVMQVAKGKITIIAHVAATNTKDSMELAAHAESLGVDAIAAIPPIYFKLPEYAIAKYWNDISSAAPNTDFFIYNIPQLTGVELTRSLLSLMLENPKVMGIKSSAMEVKDICDFKLYGSKNLVVLNGEDTQFIAGRIMGADGGVGGTYGVMPELYLKLNELFKNGQIKEATELQYKITEIVDILTSCKSNLYAIAKEILRKRENIDIGGVRPPLPSCLKEDEEKINICINLINEEINKNCNINVI